MPRHGARQVLEAVDLNTELSPVVVRNLDQNADPADREAPRAPERERFGKEPGVVPVRSAGVGLSVGEDEQDLPPFGTSLRLKNRRLLFCWGCAGIAAESRAAVSRSSHISGIPRATHRLLTLKPVSWSLSSKPAT